MQRPHHFFARTLGAYVVGACLLSGCFTNASEDLRPCNASSDCLTGESCVALSEKGSGLWCLKVSGITAAVDTSVDTFDTFDTFDNFTEPPRGNYYFVRINDQSLNMGANPGADIDAVSITKAVDGSRHYAQRVEDYSPINVADISVVSILPDNILGEPTGFGLPFDPANAGADKECSLLDENYVSLGGVGGYIIVSFGEAYVENGDVVTVYEIGNCNGQGQGDPIEVQVSVASAADGEWVTVFVAVAGPCDVCCCERSALIGSPHNATTHDGRQAARF